MSDLPDRPEFIELSDLREILAHTSPTTYSSSRVSTPNTVKPTLARCSNFDFQTISEEYCQNASSAPQLFRCLSVQQIRDDFKVRRNFSKRFSLFSARNLRNSKSAETSARHKTQTHKDQTSAWLRNSNFDLREEEIEEGEGEGEAEMGCQPNNFSDERRPDQLARMNSNFSLSSETGSIDKIVPDCAETAWMRDKDAKTSLLTACTVFYALFLTIFSLVLELAHLLNDEESRKLNNKDIIFGLYMYGGSILFFFYMYIVLLLNPRWYTTMRYFSKIFKYPVVSPSSDSLSSAAATVRKVTHSSPSAGSLFLRLGSVIFGVIGVVYYAFLVFLSHYEQKNNGLSTALDVCAILFIFIQMHFIFCNWKLSITGSHMVARIGTMHLVAANLWTWIRYVLMEEGVMEREIRDVFAESNRSRFSSDSSEESNHHSSEELREHLSKEGGHCQAAECILGSLSEVMFTSIVEYSLIAAAVMYIVWRNIGKYDGDNATYVKRKHQIRVDCSKTTTGLFLGLAFLAITFTSMVVYYGFTMLNKSRNAALVYAFTDMFQYVMSTIGVFTAIYQMRALKYFNKKVHMQNRDQELLDQILLSIGLVGELIYSVAGLVGLTGETSWTHFTFILLFVHVFRLLQVGSQTFLLHVARSVRMGCEDKESQPGKQAITFLLTANLAIFFMNLFESEKAGVSEIIINFYGKRSWVFLVRSFSPLTIFYRFHSSVCFAEIWKNVYASKSIHHQDMLNHSTSTPSAQINL
ncbi:unnamed protein product [Caenorhabditis angaria]|uniref:Uncharacterized protein n=1 Tax=Caenorhabditis angaria TaxID=860376 RepID=A0A9P1IMJ3_9PELO|nr:unnamed protein product [Caenorhabditis angaria]